MLPKVALVKSRKAIESLYADTCRIITEKDTVDPDTGNCKNGKGDLCGVPLPYFLQEFARDRR